MSLVFAILITIILTLAVVLLFATAVIRYYKELLSVAIDVACYVNTFHYMKNIDERVKIGQEKFYNILFGEKYSKFRKDRTDYIFWVFYTQWFDKLLDVIPLNLNRENNRTLAEGETVDIQKTLDETQDTRLTMFGNIADKEELHKILESCENVAVISAKNSDE